MADDLLEQQRITSEQQKAARKELLDASSQVAANMKKYVAEHGETPTAIESIVVQLAEQMSSAEAFCIAVMSVTDLVSAQYNANRMQRQVIASARHEDSVKKTVDPSLMTEEDLAKLIIKGPKQ